METIKKPLCIIPARGGSKRFPRKNITLLNGKPLLSYAVEAAIASGIFHTICVSSEDDEILAVAKRYERILPLKRRQELAADTTRIVDLCQAILKEFKSHGKYFDEFAVLLTTSPLRTAEDVRYAYRLLKENDANAVMSVVPFEHTPQTAVWAADGYLKFFFDKRYISLRQEMTDLYHHDGAIYFSKTDAFLKNPVQYGEKVIPYYIPPERSVDINNPIDLEWAKFLMSKT